MGGGRWEGAGVQQSWGQLPGKGAHLLFEVANGVLICIGEEVEDVVLDVVLLQVVHQVRPIALGKIPSETGTPKPQLG